MLSKALYLRLTLLLFAIGFLTLAGSQAGYAQTRTNADSAARARQKALELVRTAQKRSLDSARTARQQSLESLKAIRERRTDSMQAMRKYRESRRFRDSVTHAREERVATIREAQRARMDSMKDARERVTDSIIAAREAATAIIRKAQQKRADSLASIKKYKMSKRFADSVAIVKRERTDSIKTVRKAHLDSMTAARKANLDQLKADRKKITDSLAAIRKIRTDSLAVKRKAREAALAKKKENSTRDQKLKEKQAENKAQLAFELKIKKKRSVYSNENMLKKKWTAPRKAVQNTFTHYNYYFNANRKMEEAEANMQRTARDNWDDRIPLFTFDPAKDSTTFGADMDSVIQKTSLGIQIHDPRTKWADDLYLLLGKAYFYKGDLENATASFKYIVALHEKEKADAAKKSAYSNSAVRGGKREIPSIVVPEQKGLKGAITREPATNEGLLWLAHTYTTYGHYGEAETVLDLIGTDPKFPESLKGELALEKGFLALKDHNDKEAAAQLLIAVADKDIPTYTRRRAAFLAGQLLQDAGSYNEAARQYALVTDLHPKIDMDFYARRNRAYALMQSGGVQKDAIASLKSMLNDGKYSPYYEQIYYVLGQLSANAGNSKEAIAYLRQGLASAKTTKKQKALSFATLGNLYFAMGAYPESKIAFDSVSRFAVAAQDDSNVALAMRRAPIVDKIALPAYIVQQQDSLLALGSMSEKEQRAVIRKYIRALQKRKEDSAFKAENAGMTAAAAKDNSDAAGGDVTASSWYFANPAQIQQGITDFKRKWGNRPLADNWRRAQAIASASPNLANTNTPPPSGDSTRNGTNAVTSSLDENGLPTEDALMAFIPRTTEARAIATTKLQRAYVDLASAYVKQFEDYPKATGTLDTFDKRWSFNPYTAEATYLRYLIALRGNDLKEAQRLSAKIQKEFPGTQWAGFVAPASSDNTESGPVTASVGEYYDATYNLLQERQYGEVLNRTRTARRQFSNEVYSNRFSIVEAMAYAGSAQYDQADTILTTFIKTHKDDSLRTWAEQVLSYIAERRKADTLNRKPDNAVNTPASPASASVATSSPTGSGPATSPITGNAPVITPTPDNTTPVDTTSGPIPDEYSYKANEPHYFVFGINKMEPRVMGVKAGISDLNTFRYNTVNLNASVVPLKAGRAMIVVKTFKNAAAARTYLASFRDAKTLVREYQPNEYQTFVISAANYRKLIKDGGFSSYLPFYRDHY
jgi:tetratricopeptide (TPR) repeat protein